LFANPAALAAQLKPPAAAYAVARRPADVVDTFLIPGAAIAPDAATVRSQADALSVLANLGAVAVTVVDAALLIAAIRTRIDGSCVAVRLPGIVSTVLTAGIPPVGVAPAVPVLIRDAISVLAALIVPAIGVTRAPTQAESHDALACAGAIAGGVTDVVAHPPIAPL
jgi:hypothetical protein